jgi:hypothetical protein
VGQHRNENGDDAAGREQERGPARHDAGTEQRDAKDETAEQVAGSDASRNLGGGANVADDVTAAGDSQEVVDELRRLLGQRRQDDDLDEGPGRDDREAGREEEIAEQPEHPHALDVSEIHPGDPDRGQCRHRCRQEAHRGPLSGRDGGDVLRRVNELNQDEDQPCRDGGEPGDAGQLGGGDGHAQLLR